MALRRGEQQRTQGSLVGALDRRAAARAEARGEELRGARGGAAPDADEGDACRSWGPGGDGGDGSFAACECVCFFLDGSEATGWSEKASGVE